MREIDYLEKRFAKTASVASRKIAGKFILIPIRQKAKDLDGIYNLNEVASRIWELIDGEKQVGEIGTVIVEEFEVELEEAQIHLVEFLQQLEEINAVKEI